LVVYVVAVLTGWALYGAVPGIFEVFITMVYLLGMQATRLYPSRRSIDQPDTSGSAVSEAPTANGQGAV
jgi:hypothetical protein